jgi:ascorbate-specific PTS system EIIC-type component UlaA
VAVFAALGAFVGEEYNAFQRAGLPDWFSQLRGDDVTATAIIWGLIFVVLVLGGGYLGGKLGETYHRKVDAALADSAAGVAPPATR